MKFNTFTITFIFICMMIHMPIDVFSSTNTNYLYQFDKNTMIKKKISDARNYISNGDFLAAQNTINSILKLDPDNSTAKELLEECEVGIQEQKRKEYQDYLDACKKGTVDALRSYMSNYPKGEYVADAQKRIEDCDLWLIAKNANTIEAYNSYLKNSTILAYKSDANSAINSIKSELEWEKCKSSNDDQTINSFIKLYPSSPHIADAKYRLNTIKGEQYYKAGNLDMAYAHLSEANNYQKLTGEPLQHLNAIIEKKEYENIIISTNISKLKEYLNRQSKSSPYYMPVSNRIAKLLASSLTMFSTEYSMKEALSYAKDEETKNAVMYYVSKAKKDRADYEHRQKVLARKAWWKDRFMVGWNILHFDYWSDEFADTDGMFSLGSGVRFRFGRWSDFANLLFGAEYAFYYLGDLGGDGSRNKISISHQLEIPIGVRLNLFKVGRKAKFYTGCNADFGFNFSIGNNSPIRKQTLAIEPQIGFAGKRLDFGLYYKKYLKEKSMFLDINKNDQRVGFFLTCYF